MSPGPVTYLCSCLVAVFCLIVVATLHILSWSQRSVSAGLYTTTEEGMWEEKMQILPLFIPSWIFVMWIIMYVWQISWLVFGVVLIAEETRTGWLFKKPSLIPPSTYLSFAIGLAGILGWLILWDHPPYDIYAPLCLLVTCACGFFAMAKTLVNMINYATVLKMKFIKEMALSRLFTHNGLGLFTAWNIVVIMYNVAYLVCRGSFLTSEHASFIFLGLLLSYELILFTADIFLARYITTGLITPYLVVSLAYVQVLLVNLQTLNMVFMVATIMTGFSVLIIITKVIVDSQRCRVGFE